LKALYNKKKCIILNDHQEERILFLQSSTEDVVEVDLDLDLVIVPVLVLVLVLVLAIVPAIVPVEEVGSMPKDIIAVPVDHPGGLNLCHPDGEENDHEVVEVQNVDLLDVASSM